MAVTPFRKFTRLSPTKRGALAAVLFVGLAAACSSNGAGNGNGSGSAGGGAAANDPTTITIVTGWLEDQPDLAGGFYEFLEKVEEKSDGELVFEVIGSSEVYPGPEMHSAAGSGAVDAAHVTVSWYKDDAPEAAALEYSELSPAGERESGAFDRLDQMFQEDHNLKYLGRTNSGQQHTYYLNEPVSSIEDFAGMRLRATPASVPVVRALDAEPVSIPAGEVYSALERGVVEGTVWPDVGILPLSFEEVLQYKVYPSHFRDGQTLLMNLDVWESLTDEERSIINEAMVEVEDERPAQVATNRANEDEAIQEAGMEILTFSDEEAERYLALTQEVMAAAIREDVGDGADELLSLFSEN